MTDKENRIAFASRTSTLSLLDVPVHHVPGRSLRRPPADHVTRRTGRTVRLRCPRPRCCRPRCCKPFQQTRETSYGIVESRLWLSQPGKTSIKASLRLSLDPTSLLDQLLFIQLVPTSLLGQLLFIHSTSSNLSSSPLHRAISIRDARLYSHGPGPS